MIDPQKETAVGLLPSRVTFARRKIDELEIVAVRILKVESLDAGCRLVPIWNPLRAGGGVLYFVSAQLLVGFVHIAHDDSDNAGTIDRGCASPRGSVCLSALDIR